jgi:hypothetical protein
MVAVTVFVVVVLVMAVVAFQTKHEDKTQPNLLALLGA